MSDTLHEPDAPKPGDAAKEMASAAIAAAAVNAARGAAVGGAAGAAVGAVKGAAVSLAKDRRTWMVVLGVLLVSSLIIGGGMLASISSLVSLTGSMADTLDKASVVAVTDEGVDEADASEAMLIGKRTGVPWQIILAASDVNPETDWAALGAALNDTDTGRRYRELTYGATWKSSKGKMEVAAREPYASYHKAMKTSITAALVKVGFSSLQAGDIYQRGLAWALADKACQPNPVEAQPAGAGGPSEDGSGYLKIGDISWSAAQVQNMRVVIGVAKTMFPGAEQEAAIVGLITARVEGGFRNYANDGRVGAADFNMGGYTEADYAQLAYSLTLPHDAVGSDHASLGIMQQQATMGWGDYGNSKWRTEPNKVIERLMDPSFAAAKFYQRLDALSGWQGMEPGVAAQRVQVSAHPDRYQKHVEFARQAYAKLNGSAPPLDVPKETGWKGATGSVKPGSGGGVGGMCDGGTASNPVTGKWAWPIETDASGKPTGVVSSAFGWRIHPSGRSDFHEGTDYTGRGGGSGIFAAGEGTVVISKTWSWAACQDYVEILHPDGTSTGYLHLASRTVSAGQRVSAGQKIGTMGGLNPGGCTFGYHLHMYAFDKNHDWVDPAKYLSDRGLHWPGRPVNAGQV